MPWLHMLASWFPDKSTWIWGMRGAARAFEKVGEVELPCGGAGLGRVAWTVHRTWFCTSKMYGLIMHPQPPGTFFADRLYS
jgi:hypothetical protein